MYGFSKKTKTGFEETLSRARDELRKQGFGVLTEIDVKETLKKKLDVEFRRYTILGACNPPFAHQALRAELEIGLLLPCNVIVYENDEGGSTVAVMDASLVATVTGNEALVEMSREVNDRLRRALDAI